jgi:hypothetical protein
MCKWYLLCTNPADGVVKHPILGNVPTCTRCAEKHDLELMVVCPDCGNVKMAASWQSDVDPGERTVTGDCGHQWAV